MRRAGDGLILTTGALMLALTVGDIATGGGVAAWASEHLASQAQAIGGVLGTLGQYGWPLLLIPLVAGLAGRFLTLPTILAGGLRRAIGLIDSLNLSLGGAARWFALGLVIATATVVIQRYVFGYASTKLAESVIYMHALLFLLASASTLLSDGHVRVDIFYSKMSERGKAWVDLIGTYLALIPTSALILWASTGYMNSTWRILERSREADGLPLVFALKTAIPLFAILMILQGLSMAARAALTIAGQEAPPTPANASAGEM
ncbi:TRAP transporter small permease subunit [uncultured Maricaulis sp.]|uniref:TRAP transporter small permease subunit n=1 Tax=uncultured Maricaulis sp. TaxID=174710 RepID=UPI0030D7A125|tara:strand:- start:235400 stop:236185 length:786 start_codon:yes stop_codon:yes gene_type:complete